MVFAAIKESVLPGAARDRLPDGPKDSPVRQLVEMGTRPLAFLDRCRRDHGDLFTVRLLGQEPMVYVGDRDAVQWAFSQPRENFTHVNDLVGITLGDRSVLLMDGEQHRRERHMLMPIFHGARMRAYGGIMRDAARRGAAGWPEGVPLTVHPRLHEITLEVISKCIFGTTDGAQFDKLQRHVGLFLDAGLTPALFMAALVIPPARIRGYIQRHGITSEQGRWYHSIASGAFPWQRLANYRAEIDRIIYAEISRSRAAGQDARENILALLVAARDDNGAGLTDDEIRDEVLTLLVAGHETTATTIAWALHHILGQPAIQERLYQELSTEFPDGLVQPARIGELPYLKAVVNETLRLTPIAVAVVRRLTQPARVAGHDLPAGTVLAPSVYVAHRSPRNWDRPDEFEPARFLDGNASPFEFFPFGGGARRCVGAEFARYQLAVVLGQLFLSKRFEPVTSFNVRPQMRGATVGPSPKMPVMVYSRPAATSSQQTGGAA